MAAGTNLPAWLREHEEKADVERQAAIASVIGDDPAPGTDIAALRVDPNDARDLADHIRLLNKALELTDGTLLRAEHTIEAQKQVIAEFRARAAKSLRLEEALKIAIIALTRLSQNDEMAGMGQRDDDPEAIARCRYAANALEQIKEG